MTLLIIVHRSQKLTSSVLYNISSIIDNVCNHKTETSTQSMLLSRDIFSFIFRTQFEFTLTLSTRKEN